MRRLDLDDPALTGQTSPGMNPGGSERRREGNKTGLACGSPEPSPFGYDVSGLAHEVNSLRRATHSDAPEYVGVGKPTQDRRVHWHRRMGSIHPAPRAKLLSARCQAEEAYPLAPESSRRLWREMWFLCSSR